MHVCAVSTAADYVCILAEAADIIDWKPTRPHWQQQRPRGRREVPRLSQLCCVVVANYIDSVESLQGLPQLYLVRLPTPPQLTGSSVHVNNNNE